MSTTTSSSSLQSTLQSAEFRQTAVHVLTVIAPPAAIVLQQGKADLDSRQLALSLALYCSFIFYLPAVLHAYWLLNIRDSGFEPWLADKRKVAADAWETRGGRVKERVDETIAKVKTTAATAQSYAEEKVKFVREKRNQVVNATLTARDAVVESAADLRDAYETGRARSWVVEKFHEGVEKVRAFVAHYPRLEAVVVYVEKRLPAVIDFAKQAYELVKAKVEQFLSASKSVQETVVEKARPVVSAIPRLTSTTPTSSSPSKRPTANGKGPASPVSVNEYESAEDTTLNGSFNEDADHSQEM